MHNCVLSRLSISSEEPAAGSIQTGLKFNIKVSLAGLETNARPLARGELNSVRASGSSDLTSPVGEWIFYFIFYFLFFYF